MKAIYIKDNKIQVLFCIENSTTNKEDVLKKDIPFNSPYIVLKDEDALPNFLFLDAWEVDFSNPDGFGMGYERWMIQKCEKEISENINVQENMKIIRNLKKEIFKSEGVRL